jgi:hypothetical protein
VPLLAVCASYTTISNLNLTSHGTSPQQVEIGLAVFELFGNQGAQHNMFDKISVDLDRNQGGSTGISSFSTTSPEDLQEQTLLIPIVILVLKIVTMDLV